MSSHAMDITFCAEWILLSVQNFLFSLCQYVIVLSLCVGM